ncbi:TPA: glycosyltransferase family 1 protein [Klebsiella pneumoniae]|uniref:Putative glycosyltransferase n=5 Tax=Klebsiella pneumoniae TaxID=573 RepID=A0A1C3SZG8_KLEPN|nr:glycosyltransferase [Klebsiella pneumoniae]EIW8542889.1 glycosyltransferase family 1 protein [Klebsiella pneumoniae]EIW9279210.1 glycosyltransferase family 1 protein [Klebsiella pneumoniae]MBD7084418.1 glycosyltransferase family 1 protein [Klebsiella pneumoniae]MBD7432242.1 glycosyltransferase family 1 protein [Klebsiella pneumoniae]MBG1786882.1 glycosyltransferase family 1 protein [Klebsiella pneumoniae]
MMIKNIVLLSTADWDNPFWTNKQHVSVELARMGIKVFYIDSLGLRAPSASKSDFKRIYKRLCKAINLPSNKMDNIWVWSPIILPWHKYALIRMFNKVYLRLYLKFHLKRLDISPDETIFWTYNPITNRLINFEDFKKVIYHCVDEIKEQPGMPTDVIEKAEKELLTKADIVFVTSEKLYETRKSLSSNIHYHSNVSDYNHFNQALSVQYNIPSDIKEISGVKLGFIGAISSYKLDFNLIKYIAKNRPDYNILLIGEIGEGEPGTNVDDLYDYKNIHFLGPKKYNELPNYLAFMDAALLPNNINDYTDNMFPMKFFEYLSSGRNIVSVDLKSLKEFRDFCYLSKSYDEFVSNIDRVISGDIVPLDERLSLAKKYTYESRTKKMIKIIEDELRLN